MQGSDPDTPTMSLSFEIDVDLDDGPHTPFLTDITLESGSTPADDL